jgi:hypothetical protein
VLYGLQYCNLYAGRRTYLKFQSGETIVLIGRDGWAADGRVAVTAAAAGP